MASAVMGYRVTGLRKDQVLDVAVFFYTVSVFLVTTIPGLSRITHAVLGLVGCAILYQQKGGRIRFPWRDIGSVLAVILSLYAIFSVFWAKDGAVAVDRAISLAVSVLGFLFIKFSFANGLSYRSIAYGAMVAALVNAPVALLQFAALGSTQRAEGLAGNPNLLAIQLTIAALLVLPLSGGGKRWPIVFATLMIAVATVITGSRKMLLVWAVYTPFLLGMLIVWAQRSYTRIAFALVGLIGLGCGLFYRRDLVFSVFDDLYVIRRLFAMLEGVNNSGNERMEMIRVGFELWKDAPLIGHGIDQFRVMSGFFKYSHNNYIELLSTLGFIGFLLFYSIYLFIAFKARSAATRNVVLAALAILLLWDMAVVSYTLRVNWLFLAALSYLAMLRHPKASRAQASVGARGLSIKNAPHFR